MVENLHKELKKIRKLIHNRSDDYRTIRGTASDIVSTATKLMDNPNLGRYSDTMEMLKLIRGTASDIVLTINSNEQNIDYEKLERHINSYLGKLKKMQDDLKFLYKSLRW